MDLGGRNLDSLPLHYEMEGVLLEPLRVGGLIVILRFGRNATISEGLFSSSPIKRSAGPLVDTSHSLFSIYPIACADGGVNIG